MGGINVAKVALSGGCLDWPLITDQGLTLEISRVFAVRLAIKLNLERMVLIKFIVFFIMEPS